jgi:hypothetical protein
MIIDNYKSFNLQFKDLQIYSKLKSNSQSFVLFRKCREQINRLQLLVSIEHTNSYSPSMRRIFLLISVNLPKYELFTVSSQGLQYLSAFPYNFRNLLEKKVK